MLDTLSTTWGYFMSKYSKQFKLSAIQAFLDRGRGFRHIAAQFQMDPTLLRRWVAAYQLHGEASLEKPGGQYTSEFKLSVLYRMWREKLSLRATAALFNLGNSTLVRNWEQQYYSNGTQALCSNHEKSALTMSKKASRKSVAPPSVPAEELTREQLLDRLETLETENAYLKKLEELEQEKARLRNARKKPG